MSHRRRWTRPLGGTPLTLAFSFTAFFAHPLPTQVESIVRAAYWEMNWNGSIHNWLRDGNRATLRILSLDDAVLLDWLVDFYRMLNLHFYALERATPLPDLQRVPDYRAVLARAKAATWEDVLTLEKRLALVGGARGGAATGAGAGPGAGFAAERDAQEELDRAFESGQVDRLPDAYARTMRPGDGSGDRW